MYAEQPVKKRSSYLNRQRRRWSLFLSLSAFICIIVSFVTPYWLQSWPRIHTPFDRLGLWEFCLDGYIPRLDHPVRSYFGCWWIFAPYYHPILTYLLPPFFITVQVILTICLILQIIINICYGVYSCHLVRNIERRAHVAKIMFYMQCANCILLFIAIVIFGVKCQDRYWMPYPTLNWPSWSFGVAIVSNMLSIMDLPFLWLVMKEDTHKIRYAEHAFPMTAAQQHHGSRIWNKDGPEGDKAPPSYSVI